MKKNSRQKNIGNAVRHNKSGGFTLIETLVATAIFTMSILSVMIVLSGGISSTNYAKEKITAEYLAQEGIEEVRNIRDTYALYSPPSPPAANSGWIIFNSAINSSCVAPNGCYLDNSGVVFNSPSFMPIIAAQFIPCGPSSNGIPGCSPLLYDSSGGNGYQYSAGTNSGLVRKITATQVSVDETQVTSAVYWRQGTGVYNVSFSENLYNWSQ